MRSIFALALFAAVPMTAHAEEAQPAPAAAAAHYTTADTSIGTLIDDPAAKAVLDKNLPGFADNPQIEMARGMTLKAIQGFAADLITDAKLAAVDADLAKLPPKK